MMNRLVWDWSKFALVDFITRKQMAHVIMLRVNYVSDSSALDAELKLTAEIT
jgi:hypothetical protein